MYGGHYFDNLSDSFIDELKGLDARISELEEERDAAERDAENYKYEVEAAEHVMKEMADEVDALANTLAIALSFGHTDRIMDFLHKEFPDLAARIREHADGEFSHW